MEIFELDENCATEKIQKISKIQPFGTMMITRETTGEIVGASRNIEAQYGVKVSEIIGKKFNDVFDMTLENDGHTKYENSEVLQARLQLKADSVSARKSAPIYPTSVKLNRFSKNGLRYDEILMHGGAPFPDRSEPAASGAAISRDYDQKILWEIDSVVGVQEFLSEVIKRITSIDRVMNYRFDHLWHGEVVAESKESGLESYLGLRYPSTDIPQIARDLYLKNPFRIIYNLSETETELEMRAEDVDHLDLSYSMLRPVANVHRVYLGAMKVEASLAFPIVVNGVLWGLVSCHHYSPLELSVECLIETSRLIRLASLKIESILNKDRSSQSKELHSFLDGFSESLRMGTSNGDLFKLFADQNNMFEADMILRVKENKFVGANSQFEADDFSLLVEPADVGFGNIQVIEDLSTFNSRFEGSACILPMVTPGEFVFFWKKPMVDEVIWDEKKNRIPGLDYSKIKLSPVHSFAKWTDDVKKRGRPFSENVLLCMRSMNRMIVRKHMENQQSFMQELETQVDLFKNVLDQLREGVVITDPLKEDNPIVYTNRAFTNISGYALSEIYGKNCRFLNEKNREQPELDIVREAIKSGTSCNVRVRNTRKDGTSFINRLVVSPIFDPDGQLVNFAGIQSDVTSEVEKEEKLRHQEKLASLGEVSANIGHEINNPLTVVIGSSKKLEGELLEKGYMSSELGEWFERLNVATQRMRHIVDSLRVYSRADQGAGKKNAPFSVNQATEQTLFLIKDQFTSLGIDLKIQLSAEDTLIHGTEGYFQQILLNLLANSRDAVAHVKYPTISIRSSKKANRARVDIIDNGPGIPPESRKKVFEPYYTTKPSGKGTGLGLSLTKKLAKDLGGNVLIKDTDQGTHFELDFPVVESASDEKGSRVLVVEDDDAVRAIIADQILDMGVCVDEASDGLEALSLIKSNTYTHIFTDLRMPHMGGVRFLEAFSELGIDPIPKVIIVSANNRTGNIDWSFVKASISKPFDPLEIKKAYLLAK